MDMKYAWMIRVSDLNPLIITSTAFLMKKLMIYSDACFCWVFLLFPFSDYILQILLINKVINAVLKASISTRRDMKKIKKRSLKSDNSFAKLLILLAMTEDRIPITFCTGWQHPAKRWPQISKAPSTVHKNLSPYHICGQSPHLSRWAI